MKALVVGGAGFIGSHLCDALLENKENEVICIDNFSLGTKENISHLKNEKRFHLCTGDATDRNFLEKAFSMYKPECVFHLAANSDIQASAKNPDVEYKNTYTTTFEILSCMKKYHVGKLFFASTSAVYGDKRDELLTEDTGNLSPISYYGAAKLGSEALIHAFSYMNDISTLIFRFPNVIGSRLTHGVIYDFIKKLSMDSQRLQILGDGKQTKPYIHIQDLVDAILKFIPAVNSGVNIYNVGVKGQTSVNQIANILCEEMGLENVECVYTGGEGGWKGDVPRFQYSIAKIQEQGWKAKYSSDEAVRMTIREVLKG